MRFRAVRWRAGFAGGDCAPLRLREMPRPAKRLRRDERGPSRHGQRNCSASYFARTVEIGGTRRCNELADEMEGYDANTKICVRAHGDCSACSVNGTGLDSGNRNLSMVSVRVVRERWKKDYEWHCSNESERKSVL